MKEEKINEAEIEELKNRIDEHFLVSSGEEGDSVGVYDEGGRQLSFQNIFEFKNKFIYDQHSQKLEPGELQSRLPPNL